MLLTCNWLFGCVFSEFRIILRRGATFLLYAFVENSIDCVLKLNLMFFSCVQRPIFWNWTYLSICYLIGVRMSLKELPYRINPWWELAERQKALQACKSQLDNKTRDYNLQWTKASKITKGQTFDKSPDKLILHCKQNIDMQVSSSYYNHITCNAPANEAARSNGTT